MTKVVIARCHGNLVDPRFFQSYEELVAYTRSRGHEVYPAVVERLHVDRARNEITEMFLHPEKPRLPQYPEGVNRIYKEAEYLFFVDDDMLFPPNALVKLLAHQEPIVGGLYFARQAPYLPIAYRHVEDNQWIAVTKYQAGLQEVDAIGTGCLLIRRDVLEKLERPWFEFSDRMGEDMYFCDKAKQLGYKVLLDGDVKCKHLTILEVSEELFQAARGQGLQFQQHETDLQRISETIIPYRRHNKIRALTQED